MSPKPLHLRARDFARYRSRPLRGFVKHRLWRRVVPYRIPEGSRGLHIGSGHERLAGWVNLDIQALPEVDRALDVTEGLPFRDQPLVFAEHFLEHLPVTAALDFLVECRRVLAPGGWLRLSTPNLDWVWRHVYRPEASDAERALGGLHANRAFYGWRHRFLWNRPLLERALEGSGFDEVRFCRWGESSIGALRGIEQHETYPDTDEVPHVLIAEARRPSAPSDGSGSGRSREGGGEDLEALRREIHEHFLRFSDC
ncbi:MAG: hypothetical protein AAGF23_07695 [Acidobacteriota bacterium]